MKKMLVWVLALALLYAVGAAAAAEESLDVPGNAAEYGVLAEYMMDDFASLKTKREGSTTTVTLSKAVDSLQANWMGYQEKPETLTVSDLTATVDHTGHKYQLGTIWTNGYWKPFIWEENHDVYFNFTDSKAEIEAGIASVRNYMNSGDYQKTAEAQEWMKGAEEVVTDVDVQLPQYGIYTLTKVEGTDGTMYERNDLKIFDYGTDMSVIEAAYEQFAAENPDQQIYMGDLGGHAWGRLVGKEYFETQGAPDYAYITMQGDYRVIYGRNGSLKYFEKVMDNADLFGIGAGKAIFTYKQENKNWYLSKVKMEFTSGPYQAVTAEYDRYGKLRGIGLKKAE